MIMLIGQLFQSKIDPGVGGGGGGGAVERRPPKPA